MEEKFLDYIINLLSFILKVCGWFIIASLITVPLLIILLILSISSMSLIEIIESFLLISEITFIIFFSSFYYYSKKRIYRNKKYILIYIIVSLLVIFINDGYIKAIIGLMSINVLLFIGDYIKDKYYKKIKEQ